MPTNLTVSPNEESTVVITAACLDEDGAAVVPNAVTWTLTDAAGTVINSREAVALTPAESMDIVLSGDDLAVPNPGNTTRHLLIEGNYDSTAGSGLPIRDQATFKIANLVGV